MAASRLQHTRNAIAHPKPTAEVPHVAELPDTDRRKTDETTDATSEEHADCEQSSDVGAKGKPNSENECGRNSVDSSSSVEYANAVGD